MNVVLERPGEFATDILSDDGRVDAKKLATAIDVSLGELARILGVKAKNLSESPTSRKIQPAARTLLIMMTELSEHLQERRYANFWLRTPQPELGNQAPLEWLLAGKLDIISDYVARAVERQPD